MGSKGCGDLLKPGETVNSDHYENQIVELKKFLIAKLSEWTNKIGKLSAKKV